MSKKNKQQSPKEIRKTLLLEIEAKLAETIKGYHTKISKKKFEKQLHKIGKKLSKSLTKEQITVAHKKKIKEPKKTKQKLPEKKEELAS